MERTFLLNVLRLSSGTTLAHLFTIAVSPILTRLYSASDFGELQFFQSAVIITSLVTTGCYHYMIVHPREDSKALALMKGIWLLSISSALIVLVIGILIKIFTTFLDSITLFLIILFPITFLFNNLILLGDYWFLRKEGYKTLSISKITRSSSTAITQIGLFFTRIQPGLLLGLVVGRFLTLLYFLNTIGKDLVININKIKFYDALSLLKKYKAQPIQVLPSSFFSVGSTEMVIFIIAAFFGDIFLGFYALSFRVLSVPSAFIGTSVGEVFYQKATILVQEKQPIFGFLLKTWLSLALISLLPLLFIYFTGEQIMMFIFGEEWIISGTIATLLAPLIFVSFISAPTGKLLMALGEQKMMPTLSLLVLISRVSGLIIGFYANDSLLAIKLMALFHVFALIIYNLVLVVKVNSYQNRLDSVPINNEG